MKKKERKLNDLYQVFIGRRVVRFERDAVAGNLKGEIGIGDWGFGIGERKRKM